MIYSDVTAGSDAVGDELINSQYFATAPYARRVTGIGLTGAAANDAKVDLFYGNTLIVKDHPSNGTIDFVDPDTGLTRINDRRVCGANIPLRLVVTDAFPASACSFVLICKKLKRGRGRWRRRRY